MHPVAGDIRFRMLPFDKVEDWSSVDFSELFANGHDLLDYEGFYPWRVSLLSIIYKRRSGLYDFMKERGHISEAAETEAERFHLAHASRETRGMNSRIVDKITDPFVLNLAHLTEDIIFLQQEGPISHYFSPRKLTNVPKTDSMGVRHTGNAYSGTNIIRLWV